MKMGQQSAGAYLFPRGDFWAKAMSRAAEKTAQP